MLLTQMPNKAPCKDCDGRHVGCHSMCTDYQVWKKRQNEIVEARDKEAKSTPDMPRALKRKYWKGLKRGSR